MTSWHTAELARTYAAGSEVDPHYSDLDDPAPRDTRSDTERAAAEAASRRAWGLPVDDEHERSDAA